MYTLKSLFNCKMKSKDCCRKNISKNLDKEINKIKEMLEERYKKKYGKKKSLPAQNCSDYVARMIRRMRCSGKNV